MRDKFVAVILLAVFVVAFAVSCEEDESKKGRQLIDMIHDSLDFMIAHVDEVEEGALWDITLATGGVRSGRAEIKLRYFDQYGWILYGLDTLVDSLPNWVDCDRVAYEVARSYDLDYDSDLGPIAYVSTHMDSSELRQAVLAMSGAYATLDAVSWYEEEF